MQMLRGFFVEAHYQFKITSRHLAGQHNDLADDLSRDRLTAFLSPTHLNKYPPFLSAVAPPPQQGMDVSTLDEAVQYFCTKGIAQSTHRTYQSALRKFHDFCSTYAIISPFPVSEAILCYFSTYLANQKLSPQTVKTYLAGIHHMQVTLGLPEPKAYSSLPRLRLVQAGIQRTHAKRVSTVSRVRLPITPAILLKMKEKWSGEAANPDIVMLWAASSLCFFGFFRSGEITVRSQKTFDPRIHLSWGDVTIDNTRDPSMLRVKLKQSKTDQLGKGVDVYVGKTGCPLCPIAAVTAYMSIRGSTEGPFFQFRSGQPLTKSKFTQEIRAVLEAVGLPYKSFAGHSFRIGAATTAAKAGIEDSVIKMLDRWSSSAFLVYVRTPREQLSKFAGRLANS